jgi:hypothetical protein
VCNEGTRVNEYMLGSGCDHASCRSITHHREILPSTLVERESAVYSTIRIREL